MWIPTRPLGMLVGITDVTQILSQIQEGDAAGGWIRQCRVQGRTFLRLGVGRHVQVIEEGRTATATVLLPLFCRARPEDTHELLKSIVTKIELHSKHGETASPGRR